MSAAILVASRAKRGLAKLALRMTIGAIQLGMNFVQTQAHQSVLEIRLIPAGMTGGAFTVHAADSLAGGMTGPTIQFGMKLIQRPAGHGVRELGFFLGIMALITGVGSMAVIADGVNLFHTLFHLNRFLQVMTVAAAFPFVTIGAA